MKKVSIGSCFAVTTPALLLLVLVIAPSLRSQTHSAKTAGGPAMFALHTTAFAPGGEIPQQYTCSGADESPALNWSNPPQNTRSFALIADDPDAPSGTFTHWVIYAIPAQSKGLSASVPKTEQLPDGTRQGRNSFSRIGYGGPCPPPGKPHRYFFKLYALDATVTLEPGTTKAQLEKAMSGHILGQAEVMGTFKR